MPAVVENEASRDTGVDVAKDEACREARVENIAPGGQRGRGGRRPRHQVTRPEQWDQGKWSQ